MYVFGHGTITIPIKRDNLVEGTETLSVQLATGSGYSISYPDNSDASGNVAFYNVLDDPPIVSISLADGNATEQGSGDPYDPASFTVTRTGGDTNTAIDVLFAMSGSASDGTDYSTNANHKASVTTSGPITLTPIDDTVAEGVETIIATLTNPGTTYLFGAPGTNPAAPTSQASIDDNASVQSISVDKIDPPIGQADEMNQFNGFVFYDKVTIIGEHLDKVGIQQEVEATTNVTNFFGSQMTPYQIENLAPNYPAGLLNSDDWTLDWTNSATGVVPNTHNGTALIGDKQEAVTQIWDLGTNDYYTYLFSVQREFKIQAYNTDNDNLIQGAIKYWHYHWSNSACAWQTGDTPAPPYNYAAVDYKNDGKGVFSDVDGISGLLAMN
jgi:hypothetical protein